MVPDLAHWHSVAVALGFGIRHMGKYLGPGAPVHAQ